MTKAQRIIILIAAALIVAAIIYPPYVQFTFNPRDLSDWQRTYSGWTWIFDMRQFDELSGERGFIRYQEIRLGTLVVEIFGILVLAAAGLLVTKNINRD